jgi:hypothetical protein
VLSQVEPAVCAGTQTWLLRMGACLHVCSLACVALQGPHGVAPYTMLLIAPLVMTSWGVGLDQSAVLSRLSAVTGALEG